MVVHNAIPAVVVASVYTVSGQLLQHYRVHSGQSKTLTFENLSASMYLIDLCDTKKNVLYREKLLVRR